MVREKIVATAAAIRARFPSSKVRVAFVGYRDYGERIDRVPFTDDVSAFKAAMYEIEVSGGGDAPEDVFSGLEAVAQLEWTSAGGPAILGLSDLWSPDPKVDFFGRVNQALMLGRLTINCES